MMGMHLHQSLVEMMRIHLFCSVSFILFLFVVRHFASAESEGCGRYTFILWPAEGELVALVLAFIIEGRRKPGIQNNFV